MYVILHPKRGWFCADDFGGFGFSDSLPDILYWFDSMESAQKFFESTSDRLLLEIYYPAEERGKNSLLRPPEKEGAFILYTKDMYKVVVFVPVENVEHLRAVIGNAGGGKIGNYSHCSFSTRGTGRFKPLKGAKPAIGEIGKPEEVEEERIEFVCREDILKDVLTAIRAVHPYEEPAIDVWKLEDIS